MTLIQRIAGCSKARAWRGTWGEFDLEKPYDALRWRTLHRWEWLKERPSVYKWRLADVLTRISIRLRGHRVQEGWWGIKCNEAELLRQSLETALYSPTGEGVRMEADEAEDARRNLDRLAALARATFWHDA